MSFADLFVVRHGPKPQKGTPVPTGGSSGDATTVFLTPKSLLSFPVASGVVTTIWKLAQNTLGQRAENTWVPIVISLIIGATIFIATTSDNQSRPKSISQWIVASVVGIVNSLYLATSALGLLKK